MLKGLKVMSQSSQNDTIVLCGFMGCGKSTLGKALAVSLSYDYCDTDEMLLSETGMTLPELFAVGGESYFRDREHEIVQKASLLPRTVVSTGGGVMTFERNARLLAERAVIIHIRRSFDACYAAISRRKNRPIASAKSREELLRMYEARLAAYERYADFTLSNDGSVKAAVARARAFILDR